MLWRGYCSGRKQNKLLLLRSHSLNLFLPQGEQYVLWLLGFSMCEGACMDPGQDEDSVYVMRASASRRNPTQILDKC
jgi:hypothetical protein